MQPIIDKGLPRAYTAIMHIFVEDVSGDSVRVLGDDAHHLVAVRRVRCGEVFPLVEILGGHWALGRISQVLKHEVKFIIESRHSKPKPPTPKLTLVPSIIKRVAMETVLQRSVELGVDSIIPLRASRSIPETVNEKRWGSIVKEASMQSHRYQIPSIEKPPLLPELVSRAEAPLIVLTTQPTGLDLKTWVDSQENRPSSIGILVGPEGGWTSAEEALFLQKGWGLVSFGASIMRADTASLCVLSALRYAYHTVS